MVQTARVIFFVACMWSIGIGETPRNTRYARIYDQYYRQAFDGEIAMCRIGKVTHVHTLNPDDAVNSAATSVRTDPLLQSTRTGKTAPEGSTVREQLHAEFDANMSDALVVQHLLGAGHVFPAFDYVGEEVSEVQFRKILIDYRIRLRRIASMRFRDNALFNFLRVIPKTLGEEYDTIEKLVAKPTACSRGLRRLLSSLAMNADDFDDTRVDYLVPMAVALDEKLFKTGKDQRRAVRKHWRGRLTDPLTKIDDWEEWLTEIDFDVIDQADEKSGAAMFHAVGDIFTADEQETLKQLSIQAAFHGSPELGVKTLANYGLDGAKIDQANMATNLQTMEQIRSVESLASLIASVVGKKRAESLFKTHTYIPCRTERTKAAAKIARRAVAINFAPSNSSSSSESAKD